MEKPLDTIPVTPVIPTPNYVGKWMGALPAIPPFIADQLKITVLINSNSTFKLNAIYATSQDTAVRDNGRWSVLSDTIYLNGEDCAVYDTTTHILKTLQTCGSPAAIKIEIKANYWDVPLISLSPLSVAFGINLENASMRAILAQASVRLSKE